MCVSIHLICHSIVNSGHKEMALQPMSAELLAELLEFSNITWAGGK